MKEYLIGIDPDIDKSGVAVIWRGKLALDNLTFFDLFDNLVQYKMDDVRVYIEGGWLNKSNWHTSHKNTMQVNTKIGNHTGANHEVGRKIVEMCEYLKIDYEVVRPTQTKLNAKTFKNITKYEKRTNQEQRDAAMLIFGR